MRVVMIAALAMMASGLAQSAEAGTSSIEQITTSSGKTPSVRMITCTTCAKPESHKAALDTGPSLAAGTQKIELRTVNGKHELVRTEAWLGGSPVTFINKQGGWLDNGSQLAGLTTSDGVDTTTETAAVKHDVPVQDQAPAQDTMQLRLK